MFPFWFWFFVLWIACGAGTIRNLYLKGYNLPFTSKVLMYISGPVGLLLSIFQKKFY